jgi:hypothetical protein
MATMLVEYDEKNKTVKQMFDGLFSSGVISRPCKSSIRRAIQRLELMDALYETQKIETGLAKGKKYQTMDEFLQILQ